MPPADVGNFKVAFEKSCLDFPGKLLRLSGGLVDSLLLLIDGER